MYCLKFRYSYIYILIRQAVMKNKPQDLIVCNHFKLVRKLGTGAFGEIYLAQNKSNPSEKYAAKLEEASTKFPQLYFQAKMYKYLNAAQNVVGVPKVRAITTEGQYNVMLMDLLGTSIQDIFVQHNKIMSLKSALMIGYQMIERIQFIHDRQVIHRDIKPDNFLLGINNNAHLVYIVDFGLSKKYIKDNKHIPYKEGKELTGTARYASINTHMGIQQSRRDDIESIGYVIMYLLRGILPWQNMKAKDTKAKYKMIMEKKIATPAQILCKGYPQELSSFINYARNMKFEQKPDYAHLKNLLKSAMKNNGIQMDFVYQWSKKTSKKIQEPLKQSKEEQVKLKDKPLHPVSSQKEKRDEKIVKKEQSRDKNHGTSNIQTRAQYYKGKGSNVNTSMKEKGQPSNATSNINKLNLALGNTLTGPKISTIKR